MDWWNSWSGDKQIDFDLTPTRRMYEALHTQCFPSTCKNKLHRGDSGGIQTHDLLLTSTDVLTSWPPSLPSYMRHCKVKIKSIIYV